MSITKLEDPRHIRDTLLEEGILFQTQISSHRKSRKEDKYLSTLKITGKK